MVSVWTALLKMFAWCATVVTCCIACWRALSSGKLSVRLRNWTLWKRSILIWKLLTSPRSRECFFCLQTRSRCVARPASHEGRACDPGTALPHSEGTLYRVYETLSRSREHRLARPQSTQSFLCLLQGKTMDFLFYFYFLLKPLFTLGSFFFFLLLHLIWVAKSCVVVVIIIIIIFSI